MNTKKRNLFIFAGLLWLFAGIMVMNVGIPFLINDDKMFIFGFLGAIAIFLIFYIMIFSKYVHKHKNRILNDKREQMKIWEFFDKSSYILMFFMMTFGIALRFSGFLPNFFFEFFYSGLGFALSLSGVSFLILAFKYYNF
ncbi:MULTISPECIES: hypothetical protein [unclassified Parvimonas]|uniref:hypothetical protein n=1 Tax=unclassified Parvimonas TaxID=1151464 RepID=UPI0028D478F2|nr:MULTISPECIES: hypothetical protein [unclassified Parvimonas]MEB3011501.1 hypothetical protein [Parvimonas sp. D2]MEB3086993.1 hypothetical protein [Parvimonas sp. D4]